MSKRHMKRTQQNHLIVLLLATAMMIICASSVFAAEDHGQVEDVKYIPADGKFYYYEGAEGEKEYFVSSSITGEPDILRVTYEDGTVVECEMYGEDTCTTPGGDTFRVTIEDNQSDSSWDDPDTAKQVYVRVEKVSTAKRTTFRKDMSVKAFPRLDLTLSATYTQPKGIPVMVNGYSNYNGRQALSTKARQIGDTITIEFNGLEGIVDPIKYTRTKDGWISPDGRILNNLFLHFSCEGEPDSYGLDESEPKDYEPGRYTVEGSFLGAEMEYYFDVEEDPVASVEFPSSVTACMAKAYEPQDSEQPASFIAAMIDKDKLFPEGTEMTVTYKNKSVKTFQYVQAKGGFYDAEGEKLPYSDAFEVDLVDDYKYQEGLNEKGLRVQYGTHFNAPLVIDLKEGHDLVAHDAKDATYVEDGNSEYYACRACVRFFSDPDGVTEITKNSWVIPMLEPEGWTQDGNAITYDAADDTEISADGTGLVTTIHEEEVQAMVAQIEKKNPEQVLLNAKVAEGTDQVKSTTIKIPTEVVRAATKAGAGIGIDTVVGKIEFDKDSIEGALSESGVTLQSLSKTRGTVKIKSAGATENTGATELADTTESTDTTDADKAESAGTIEVSITDESSDGDKWTVARSVTFKSIESGNEKIITDLAPGQASITTEEPAGAGEDDGLKSFYINDDGSQEALQTVRTMGMVTTVTSKMGMYRTITQRNLKNAKITGVASSYTYKGKKLKPKFKVKFSDGTTVAAKYYSVSWANNKNVGTAKITVKGKGNYYCGSKSKSFYINPKKAGKPSVKAGAKMIKVTMKSGVSATGGSKYQVQYKLSGAGKWKTAAKTSKRTVTIKKLKKGKKYKVRVRAYKGKRKGKYSSTAKSAAVK